MTDEPILPERHKRLVECPECGEGFSPRGIASHRRLRHGVAAAPAGEIGVTLTRIANVLERLDAKLAGEPSSAVGSATEPPPALPAMAQSRTLEMRILERTLREVLGEIARVKEETERQIAAWGGSATTEEQRILRQTSFLQLGTLRRRQASLLFRLQETRGDDATDNLLCI